MVREAGTTVANEFRYTCRFVNDEGPVNGEGGSVGSTMAGLKPETLAIGIETGVCPSNIGQLSPTPVLAGGEDDACRLLGLAAVPLRGPL